MNDPPPDYSYILPRNHIVASNCRELPSEISTGDIQESRRNISNATNVLIVAPTPDQNPSLRTSPRSHESIRLHNRSLCSPHRSSRNGNTSNENIRTGHSPLFTGPPALLTSSSTTRRMPREFREVLDRILDGDTSPNSDMATTLDQSLANASSRINVYRTSNTSNAMPRNRDASTISPARIFTSHPLASTPIDDVGEFNI